MSKILYEVPAPEISDRVYKIERVSNVMLKKDMSTQVPKHVVDLKTITRDSNKSNLIQGTLISQTRPPLKKQLSIIDERKKVILDDLNTNFLNLELSPIEEYPVKISRAADITQEVRERKRLLEKINQSNNNDKLIIENENNIQARPKTFTIQTLDESFEKKTGTNIENKIEPNNNHVEKETDFKINNTDSENIKPIEKETKTIATTQKKSYQIFKVHGLLLLCMLLLALFLIIAQALLFSLSFSSSCE
jgi:hypothetical protein